MNRGSGSFAGCTLYIFYAVLRNILAYKTFSGESGEMRSGEAVKCLLWVA